jgi:hypothetical protein
MSTDYDMKCVTCGKTLEMVASASIAYGNKLWCAPEKLDALRDFLFEHRGHALVFDDAQMFDEDEEQP